MISFNIRTIIKDKNGQNWIQIFYYYLPKPILNVLYIYDFKSSSDMMISPNILSLSISQPMLQSANGIVKLSSTGKIINSPLPKTLKMLTTFH